MTNAAAARQQARLANQLPTIAQLLVDQQDWISEVLASGDLPGTMPACDCSICQRARRAHELRRRFQALKLSG
jgi:hypothetical protein